MIWDPELLARIRRLHLQARVLTEALLHGEHRSRRVGQAVEFAGYTKYQPGMDLRFLDWKCGGAPIVWLFGALNPKQNCMQRSS